MAKEIKAPMAGSIISVDIEVGESVEKGDETIVIEAMKMEIPIFSPASGKIKEIKVKAKDIVETDQVLVIIE